MQEQIVHEIYQLIDQYFQVDDLNRYLKESIEEKNKENTIWSDLTTLTHRMLGGNSPTIVRRAAVTELIALSLDIADDLQDQDNYEKPWMKIPREYALNVALAFIFSSIRGMEDLPSAIQSSILQHIGKHLIQSVNGQHRDITNTVQTEEEYMRMVMEKSGSLIRLAFALGYADLDVRGEVEETVLQIASFIGVMAQIQNDVKDMIRYDVKSDIMQKKRTLPIFYLLQHSDEDFPDFKKYYAGDLPKDDFLKKNKETAAFIQESGCIEYAAVIQTLYFNQTVELFQSIETISPWNEKFYEKVLKPFEI